MNEPRLPPHPAQRVQREKRVHFLYEGRRVEGFEGETIATALYAAGVRTFSRSFKYHRRRGLLCVAGRCPNCLMEVDGVPNVRTCVAPCGQGVEVRGQHAWPSLERDVFAVFDKLAPALPVGFYYKTFIRPSWLWPVYEKALRHLAGLGRLDIHREPQVQGEHLHLHADLVVVGAGPAGIAAAREAARLGVEVLLIDDQPEAGGHLRWQLLSDQDTGPGALPGYELARALEKQVQAEPNIRRFNGATAFGLYEGRLLGVVQGERLIKVRARRVVVAAGGFETPLVFQNNDLPGVLLGEGLQRLTTLYGIRPGQRALVVTDSDRGVRLARELLAAGIEVVAIADARSDPPRSFHREQLGEAVSVWAGHTVLESRGKRHVQGAVVTRLDSAGEPCPDSERFVACDLLALATGWQPADGLLAQTGGHREYRDALGAFVVTDLPDWLLAAGEVRGARGLDAVQKDGRLAGLRAALSLGVGAQEDQSLVQALERETENTNAVRVLTSVPHTKSKRFVCLCEDVIEDDLHDAVGEGFDDMETLKRYTTVTMGPCQGKMCHAASVRICAEATGRSLDAAGPTTARPPVQPVPLIALAGAHHEPVRRTPMHDLHEAAGATWMDLGSWKRPFVYTSVETECTAVHERVGLIDVSTLGKLDIKGTDAARFLDWLHPNRFSDLKVGRVRYRILVDDAGIILDDGTVARVDEDHFFVTTGSGSLELVEQWLSWWLAGSERCVHVTDVTADLAAMNLAGPKSREVLSRLTELDLSPDAFRYLAAVRGEVAGVPVLILRIGFVGELGYELHFPAEYGAYLWEALMRAGRDFEIAAVGVEAQRVLRLEKQHIIPGHDTDALSNPLAAGMAWAVKLDKPDFIGRATLARVQERGLQERLVGFEMITRDAPSEGDAVVAHNRPVGRVTSAKWSSHLGRSIGMAWVPTELAREPGELRIRSNGRIRRARIVTEPFYDPKGKRLRS